MSIYSKTYIKHIEQLRAIANPITLSLIFERTADYYNFTVEQLSERTRLKTVVEARQMAWKIARNYTRMSYPEIAGKFDHSTVIHGVQVITKRIRLDKDIQVKYEDIVKVVKGVITE